MLIRARRSLYWRLLGWFLAANLLVLLLGGWLARGFIAYTTVRDVDWAALAADADAAYAQGGSAALAEWSRDHHDQVWMATLFEDGQPLGPFRLHGGAETRPALAQALASDQPAVLQPRPGILLAVWPLADAAKGHRRHFVALARSHERIGASTREAILLGVQALLSLLVIAAVGWWVARSVAQPVNALRATARRMSGGDLTARVPLPGRHAHGELVDLAADFNAMAGRIEALVSRDRRVLQDLSHELRSPLARLHLILDFARRSTRADEAAGYFAQAEGEIDRLDRLTGDMLALSRLEDGIPGAELETVDLAQLCAGCVARAQLEAQGAGLTIHGTGQDRLPVIGSALLLERAVDNVLANAIKFSPAGAQVDVQWQRSDAQAQVEVRDHGPGVAPEELPVLFRPFYRGSNAADVRGHGLGLAIVRRVLAAHQGDADARNLEDGGLLVRLRLPSATQ